MTRRCIYPGIAILAIVLSIALPSVVTAKEPGSVAPVLGTRAETASKREDADLTPLRGHEHVPILLGQHRVTPMSSPLPLASTSETHGMTPGAGDHGYFPLVIIPITCWLCALLAIPRAPRRGDEVQELIHRRLVGRH